MKWLSRLMVPAAKPSNLAQQHTGVENTPTRHLLTSTCKPRCHKPHMNKDVTATEQRAKIFTYL